MTKEKQPVWMSRADWRAGVISSEAVRRIGIRDVYKHGLGAVFGIGVYFMLRTDYPTLVDVAAIALAIIGTVQFLATRSKVKRYGVCEFQFDELPFTPTNGVRGTVVAPFATSGTPVRLRLVCEAGDESGGGTLYDRVHTVLEHQILVNNGKMVVPVDLALPSELRSTSAVTVEWRLSATFDIINYTAKFLIAVAGSNTRPRPTLRARSVQAKLKRDLSVFDDEPA